MRSNRRRRANSNRIEEREPPLNATHTCMHTTSEIITNMTRTSSSNGQMPPISHSISSVVGVGLTLILPERLTCISTVQTRGSSAEMIFFFFPHTNFHRVTSRAVISFLKHIQQQYPNTTTDLQVEKSNHHPVLYPLLNAVGKSYGLAAGRGCCCGGVGG